ncbi:MAG: zinc-dependent alcohol dehydrogenase family protein [Pseudomonadales bacterium]|nr:zinc-dependent alcohol dehydrogenase family protein [Pseudomonadales bacterium]MBP6480895.1 zinc-dependent alcohol dehydrogenase family protein [Pseudomonadales bacterium]
MRAMVLHAPGEALRAETRAVPRPGPEGVLLRVLACGICRTDLHVVDGELREPRLPLVPGHQIVGEVVARGARVAGFAAGERIGVPWLGGSCGDCDFCRAGEENLCDGAVYTGYQVDGGFAQYCVADARYCFAIPPGFDAVQAAPLLCAGLIGYRSYRPARAARRIGFYGFGAAAHILVQVARHHGQEVYAFTRPGDHEAQEFARRLGAVWAGDSSAPAPVALDAAIIFAPEGELVPRALRAVRKGGRVICAGIHMSDIPSFAYADLWGERHIESVANLTRRDGEEFLPLAAALPVRTEVHRYALADVNRALDDLRAGRFTGAAVVIP